MPKEKKTNKGKQYDKPLSLHPMSVDEALKKLMEVKPPEKEGDNKNG